MVEGIQRIMIIFFEGSLNRHLGIEGLEMVRVGKELQDRALGSQIFVFKGSWGLPLTLIKLDCIKLAFLIK